MRRYVPILFVLLLAACSTTQTFPEQEYQPRTVSPEETVRPAVNRTIPPDSLTPQREPNTSEEPQEPEPEPRPKPKRHTIDVRYGVLGFNQSLDHHTEPFTKYQFPALLKSRNVKGHAYEQRMQLAGGSIRFRKHEDTVSDFLYYEEDEPILRYTFILHGTTFLDIIGEQINVLGNTYTVTDATAKDVILENDHVQLVIGGGSVDINGEAMADTTSSMTGSKFVVESRVDTEDDDELAVPAGSSVQEHLAEPTMLTDKLDIRYDGLVPTPATTFQFQNTDDGVRIRIKEDGERRNVPLIHRATMQWGDEEGRLVFDETQQITSGDYVILASDRSHVLQYHGIDGDELDFSNGYMDVHVRLNTTAIPLQGKRYRFSRTNETLRLDLNGDGDFKDTVRYRRPGYAFAFGNRSMTFRFSKDTSRTVSFKQGERVELIPKFRGYELRDGFAHATDYGTRYVFTGELEEGFEDGTIIYPNSRGKGKIVLESSADRPPYVRHID